MTRLILASTFYQAVSLASMVDGGFLGGEDERRILLTSNNALAPELTPDVPEMLGAESVLSRFDAVHSWNDIIEPSHPKDFGIPVTQWPMFNRLVRRELGIEPDEEVSLLLESVPWAPAGTLARIFPRSPVSVHSDGLMSYGPTRRRAGIALSQRFERLLYADLVPGLEPQLLREDDIERSPVPAAHMRKVFAGLVPHAEPLLRAQAVTADGPGCALILGQYLVDLQLLDSVTEAALHEEMVLAAAVRGMDTVIFKPHPASGPQTTARMQAAAAKAGLAFQIADVPVSAEVLFEILRPGLVISCFSTGLATAESMYGIPALAIGTGTLLEMLDPYENSNRIPLTIADRLFSGSPAETGRGSAAEDEALGDGPDGVGDAGGLNELVQAVSYCMQAQLRPDLRAAAERTLGGMELDEIRRYFKRRRLTSLDLPGRLPPRPPRPRTPMNLARRAVGAGGRRLRALRDRPRRR